MKPIRWTKKRKHQLIFCVDVALHATYLNDCTEDEKDILDFQTFMDNKGIFDTEKRED